MTSSRDVVVVSSQETDLLKAVEVVKQRIEGGYDLSRVWLGITVNRADRWRPSSGSYLGCAEAVKQANAPVMLSSTAEDGEIEITYFLILFLLQYKEPTYWVLRSLYYSILISPPSGVPRDLSNLVEVGLNPSGNQVRARHSRRSSWVQSLGEITKCRLWAYEDHHKVNTKVKTQQNEGEVDKQQHEESVDLKAKWDSFVLEWKHFFANGLISVLTVSNVKNAIIFLSLLLEHETQTAVTLRPTVLEEEAPITGNNDGPELPNLI
uniref:Uncharacterized protein n=1 Tax=Timema tahoe TaxID=61484 RepID=A0A7R9IDH1_9NEOP|nr:unnamed protein product [Timema tahoe]